MHGLDLVTIICVVSANIVFQVAHSSSLYISSQTSILLNIIAIDELESNYIGNYEIGSFGSEDNISFINVNNETTMFRFCKQSLLDTHAFPAIPGFQGGAGLRWMTNEQERFTEVYGWTSTFMIVFVIVVLAYASGYNMTRNHKVSYGTLVKSSIDSARIKLTNIFFIL